MFDIGFAEILIVAVVALIVLGPDKLPTAAKTVGMWVGRIRRTLGGIQSEISEELRLEELKRTTAIHKEQLDKELSDMQTPFSESLNESPFAATGNTSNKVESGDQASTSSQPKSDKE
ncbi:Sec-independent protein translocase protein TatB [Marinobacterium jannaschii]|uniref:Sec-independent protein translocase protein TatB n=1 Tax=Marinobacterium jannaschii TaxID=64970 RepID=UPI000486A536|nr:Sec-independent protein translocase protein TatB [Marinobacterium jannaschii]